MVDTFNASRDLNSDLSLADALDFFKTKMFQGINTIILGQVLEVDSVNKRLSIRSLINGVNTFDAPTTPPTIYDVPYGAVRGGSAGIITHFIVGDNVIIGFCQRQIDSTKTTESQSTPALYRFFSLQDAVVLSHWSNSDPTVFIKILDTEITIQAMANPITINTTGDVTINSENATINATMLAKVTAPTIELDGNVTVSETLTIDGLPFLTHTHSGVTTGGGNSGPVT